MKPNTLCQRYLYSFQTGRMTPRDCLEELERYVESKYADLLDFETEIPYPPKKVQRLMDQIEEGMSADKIKESAQKLSAKEKGALYDELRLYVADQIGNLTSTFRYESTDEGELYEEYLDSILEIAEDLKKETILPPYVKFLQTA